MENEFVSYSQALALKELGFDEPCFATYSGETLDLKIQIQSDDYFTSAPLKQQAFRWLYHKLNIKDGAMPLNEEAQNTLLKELLDKLSSKHLLA